MSTPSPEAWQRGPVPGYEPLLMPVAHALMQAREDLEGLAREVPAAHTWRRPGGAASIGFHVRHAGGALDRLFTYARGDTLSDAQRDALRGEGEPGEPPATMEALVTGVSDVLDAALAQLRGTSPEALLDGRALGRARLPTTVLGLLFHAAEHATRHVGQAVTTAKILRGADPAADQASGSLG
jgi:hypothetical protein